MSTARPQDEFLLDKRWVKSGFAKAAADFEKHAFLPQEIRNRLLQRLEYIRLQPRRIVDLGCGPGEALKPLSRRFRGAQVLGLDIAEPMLWKARRQWRWPRRPLALCADMERLPLAEACCDLAFSSGAMPWVNDLDVLFREVRRILSPGGLWLFTTFGPDTLRELRAAFAASRASAPHVKPFIDMHDIGDALVRAGFADPVMDQEVLTLTYPDFTALRKELRGLGIRNTLTGRARGLLGPGRLAAVETMYQEHFRVAERLPVTVEVVYGHAWVTDTPAPSLPPGKWIPLRTGS